MEECWGSNYLLFTYDEQGRPYSVNYNGGQYFYVLNQQGDVIRIVAGDGSIRAEYRYNAWGEVEETENSAWLGKINPLRYRGYYYDAETGLYYLNSRYYDPSIGRFINSDTTDVLMSSLESLADKNFFSYCDNNPVVRRDAQGNAWETVFDIISLGASITEVAVNPTDPWAWLGLVGDVAVPFVGGIGEATKTLKQVANATNHVDEIIDVEKLTTNTLEVIKNTASKLEKGENTVYVSYKNGLLEYVGITNCFERRKNEWDGIRTISPLVSNLDRAGARYIEQTVISVFGMSKKGGLLSNSINSIGIHGSKYKGYVNYFDTFLT